MNTETVNPLRQYFRRPALYLKLPSNGMGYSSDVLELPENGELPVYPMTAIDEITTKTPDALYNGTAVVEIIKSCIPGIKDPWQLLSTDLDPVLIAIRIASNGQLMEIITDCPSCSEESKYDVNLTQMLGLLKAGDYGTPMNINDLQIKFHPLKYSQLNRASESQFQIQRLLAGLNNIIDEQERNDASASALKEINELAMNLLLETIEYVKTPEAIVFEKEFIREFLLNCDNKDYIRIRDANVELRKSTELKPLEIKCIHCNHAYEQMFNINVTDFFG